VTNGNFGEAGTESEAWTFGSGNVFGGVDFETNAAIFNDFAAGDDGLHNKAGLFKGVNVSSYGGPIMLHFDYSLSVYEPEGEQQLYVTIWDNANAEHITMSTYNTNSSGIQSESIDLRNYINAFPGIDTSTLIFAFFYDDLTGGWGNGVGIDNVKLEVYEAPANDSVDSSINITDELELDYLYTNSQNTSGATNNDSFKTTCGSGAGEDGAMNDGVWYSFRILREGYVTVTVTPNSSWDPEITVYNCYGACSENCIASADNGIGNGLPETVSFFVTPPFLSENIYSINIGAYSPTIDLSEGAFDIEVSFNCVGTTPENDTIEQAIQLPHGNYIEEDVALPCANSEPTGFNGCNIDENKKTIFYKFLATDSSEVTARAPTSSPWLLDISFYEAPSLDAEPSELTFVDQSTNNCTDSGHSEFGSSSIITEAGHFYYIVIVGPYASDITVSGVVDTTSIEDVEIKDFSMYPNPVNSTLQLSAAENIQDIVIYNTIGQKVFKSTPNIKQTEINVEDLPKGSYVIKVETTNQIGAYNLLIE